MTTAIILSGGSGTRLGGDIPKQYIDVGGRSVISYCMETIFHHERIDAVQIVASEEWRECIAEDVSRYGKQDKFRGFSFPGDNRQLSIYHALRDIREYATDSDTVLIHDAARPLVTPSLVSTCLEQMAEHDGVLPILPVKDTLYYSEDGRVVDSLLDRNSIFAGQAPEAFVLGKYYEANTRLLPEKILAINGSTEPAIIAGMDIAMIPGDESNFKITIAKDLERFREIVKRGEAR